MTAYDGKEGGYPRSWQSISKFLRSYRAESRCELCGAQEGNPHPKTGKTVRLAVHHIGTPTPGLLPGNIRDKSDCRLNNLVVVCAVCHGLADSQIHTEMRRRQYLSHRRATKRAALLSAGINGEMQDDLEFFVEQTGCVLLGILRITEKTNSPELFGLYQFLNRWRIVIGEHLDADDHTSTESFHKAKPRAAGQERQQSLFAEHWEED